MKKDKLKDLFLDQLRKLPIIQLACEKIGIARSSIYRWRNEDAGFKKKLQEALAEGEDLISDLSEGQLVSMIRDKNFQAIQLWLRSHHHKYANKLEVTGNINNSHEQKLTPEQKKTFATAVRLAALDKKHEPKNKKVVENDNPGQTH